MENHLVRILLLHSKHILTFLSCPSRLYWLLCLNFFSISFFLFFFGIEIGKLYFKKSVSRNFINLATAQSTVCGTQCGNCRNSLSHFFRKNFVKAMVLLKKLLNSWFDEIFFQWERISRFSTLWHLSRCRNCRNSLSHYFAKISWKQWFY